MTLEGMNLLVLVDGIVHSAAQEIWREEHPEEDLLRSMWRVHLKIVAIEFGHGETVVTIESTESPFEKYLSLALIDFMRFVDHTDLARLEASLQTGEAVEIVKDGMSVLQIQKSDDANVDHSLWQILEPIVSRIPKEEMAKLPRDLAERHDYYLYGDLTSQ